MHYHDKGSIRCILLALALTISAHTLAQDGALEEALEPPELIIIRGPEAGDWAAGLARGYAPHRMVLVVPADADTTRMPQLADMDPGDGTVAWVCQGTHCSAPVRGAAALGQLLGAA